MIFRVLALSLAVLTPISAANLAANLSGNTSLAFANKLQDSDVPVARFVVQAGGGNVIVDAVTVSVSNSGSASLAFTGLRLFFDADANGTFAPGEELSTVQPIVAGEATFTHTFTATSGLICEFLVLATFGNDPLVYGQSYQFSLAADSSFELPAASPDTVSGTFPISGNPVTIRNSVNQLVPGTGNPTAPRGIERGTQNVGALHFLIDSLVPVSPGAYVGIDLQSLTVNITLQTAAQAAAVADLSLWQDDGDALFEPGSGEVLIQRRTPADLGKWTPAGNVVGVVFDGTAIAVLPPVFTGSARTFWVGISFVDGATCVLEVSINRVNVNGSLGPAADFFVTSPASIGGDVITVDTQPKPPRAPEAQGEGGCAAKSGGAALASWLVFVATLRRRKSKLAPNRSTYSADGGTT